MGYYVTVTNIFNVGAIFIITYFVSIANTLNSAYNKKKTKKNAEILLCYRQLFIKGDVFIGEWGVFGAEVFLRYSRFFVKGGVECTSFALEAS